VIAWKLRSRRLREAIFEAYAALVEEREGHVARGEHERRRSALQNIDEILNWQPLASFSATHLELLGSMIAYWREAEVEGEIRAPLPDPIQ
jgi:hypothetical protein